MSTESNRRTERRCAAKRVHPLTTDYYVMCQRTNGHDGPHRNDGCEWTDDNEWAIHDDRALALERRVL